MRALLVGAALLLLCATGGKAFAEPAVLREALQLLVVESPDWNATRGQLRRYERSRLGAPFTAVGAPLPVWLGRAGLAVPAGEKNGPVKREGDGKGPAGIFDLRAGLWGYAPQAPSGVKLPYHQSTASLRCVDDAESPQYNHIVSAPEKGPEPWRSAERLLLPTEHYKYLLVVEYNTAHPQPGGGSCIFIHVAPAPFGPTAGCTSLVEEDLLTVLRWLNFQKHPKLVQLPHAQLVSAAKDLGIAL